MNRSKITAIAGLIGIIFGLFFRANADCWSQDVTWGNTRYSKVPELHMFFQDTGAVLLALGVLALAAVVHRWVSEKSSE